MLNLLHGEFYKLRKSKCVYICCILMILSVMLVYGMLALADKIQNGEAENGSFGVVVSEEAVENGEAVSSVWEGIGVLDIAQQLYGSFSAVIIAIFASIFVIGEYGHGAIKNVTGKGYARWKIFLSKYLSTMVIAGILLIIMAIANLICGSIFIGTDGWNGTFWEDWICYTGIQLLFGIALVGIIVGISEICRNLGSGISVSICLVVFSTLVTGGLDLIFFKWDLKPSNYWLMDLISNCPLADMESDFVVRAVIASAMWIVLSLGIGGLHFKKADVK